MKALRNALAAAVVVLLASTVYLGYQLKLERERQVLLAAPSTPRGVASPTASTPSQIAPATQSPAAPPQQGARESIPGPTPAPAQTAAPRRRSAAEYDARLAALKAAMAPVLLPAMTYAGLDARESERFVAMNAEAIARGEQLQSDCQGVPGCDPRALWNTETASMRRNVELAVGTEKLRRLDTYDQLQSIKYIRRELPEGQKLSEDTAAELASSLAEERYRYAGDAESSAAFTLRMEQRAARILTPEQLTLFARRKVFTRGDE